MAGLYLDHNFSLRLVRPLQGLGHDVTSARDLGLERLADEEQLLTAVRANRVLITHNRRHFIMLHGAWLTWPAAFGLALPPHPGILVLDPGTDEVILEALNALLSSIPAASLRNELFRWHRRDGWRRRVAGVGWTDYP